MADLATLEKAAKEAADKLKACQIDLSVKKQGATVAKKLAAQKSAAFKAAGPKLKTADETYKAAQAKKWSTQKEKDEKDKAVRAALANRDAMSKECAKLQKESADANDVAKAKEAAIKEAEAKWKAAKLASDKAAKTLSDQKAADAAAKKKAELAKKAATLKK